jgi:hypothetical protein
MFLHRRLLPGLFAYAAFWIVLVVALASADTGEHHDRNSLAMAAFAIGSLVLLAVVGLLRLRQIANDE